MSFTPRHYLQRPSDNALSASRKGDTMVRVWEPRANHSFTEKSRALVLHIYLCAYRLRCSAQDSAFSDDHYENNNVGEDSIENNNGDTSGIENKTLEHMSLSLPDEMWGTILSFLECYPRRFQDCSIVGLLPGMRDGVLSNALLNRPNFVATTPHGDVIITDWSNGALRKISGQSVSTIARLQQPWGIAVSTRGDLYVVSDNQIWRIEKKSRDCTVSISPCVRTVYMYNLYKITFQ